MSIILNEIPIDDLEKGQEYLVYFKGHKAWAFVIYEHNATHKFFTFDDAPAHYIWDPDNYVIYESPTNMTGVPPGPHAKHGLQCQGCNLQYTKEQSLPCQRCENKKPTKFWGKGDKCPKCGGDFVYCIWSNPHGGDDAQFDCMNCDYGYVT